jgi:hypothetical protein
MTVSDPSVSARQIADVIDIVAYTDEPFAVAFHRLRAAGLTQVNALVLAAAGLTVLPLSELAR